MTFRRNYTTFTLSIIRNIEEFNAKEAVFINRDQPPFFDLSRYLSDI